MGALAQQLDKKLAFSQLRLSCLDLGIAAAVFAVM